jgi:cell division protein FtsB
MEYIMIIAIVFISVFFGVLSTMYQKHLAFKEKALIHNSQTNKENESLSQQVAQLEQRMQVLEKIVTDEGYAVHKEINNL